jgi:hypothetical protein
MARDETLSSSPTTEDGRVATEAASDGEARAQESFEATDRAHRRQLVRNLVSLVILVALLFALPGLKAVTTRLKTANLRSRTRSTGCRASARSRSASATVC